MVGVSLRVLSVSRLLCRWELDNMRSTGFFKTVTFIGSAADDCAMVIKHELPMVEQTGCGWKILWRPPGSMKLALFDATLPSGATELDLDAILA